MAEYLEKQAKSIKMLEEIAGDLHYLAHCFFITGNSPMSENIDQLVKNIIDARDLSEDAFSELFNNAIKSTQNATRNMVQAAINAVSMK